METAFDGKLSYLDCCFFHSDVGDFKPWLQVELPSVYIVSRINVFNRDDDWPFYNAADFEYLEVSTILHMSQERILCPCCRAIFDNRLE